VSRTAHHKTHNQSTTAWRPYRRVEVRALRHRTGKVAAIHRVVEYYDFARANQSVRSLAWCVKLQERQARQRLRRELHRGDFDDITPARHRRGVLWLA
jgi:hypothetical protein